MDYQKTILSNGLPVLLIPAPQRATVGLLLLIAVGSRHEEKDRQGLSRVFLNMVLKGTEKYPDTNSLSAALDKTGASLHSEVHQEYTALYLTAPSQHLKPSLELLSQLVTKPLFNLSDLKKEKTYSLDDIARYQANPSNLSFDELYQLTFGHHPLAYSSLGTKESIEKIQRDDLIAFQKKYYQAQNILLCLCGQVQGGQKMAEEYFGALASGQKVSPLPFDSQTIKSQAKVVEKDTPLVYFGLAAPALQRNAPQRRQQQLLETILGRMRTNERLLKLAGPNQFFQSLLTQINLLSELGLFLIQGIATYENIQPGYEALLKEFDKVKQTKIPDWELKKAQGFYQGSLLLRLESLVERCFFYGLAEFLEGESTSLKTVFEEIDQITPADLQAVAQQILNPSRFNVVFVGKRK